MDFSDKMVLVRLNMVDEDKGKGIIIGDPRTLDENRKICCREVVAEKTLVDKETLKITIKSDNAGWQT
jgi:Fe2+ transport system protein B